MKKLLYSECISLMNPATSDFIKIFCKGIPQNVRQHQMRAWMSRARESENILSQRE